MKNLILSSLFLLTSLSVRDGGAEPSSGSLLYSDAADGSFNSLVYRAMSGKFVRIFDQGLSFSYDSANSEDYLSSDNSYSVVHFSQSGELSDDEEAEHSFQKVYLCAFVRMSDGCVVSVDVGEQCGGEWRGPTQWSSSLSSTNKSLLATAPTIEGLYKSYASGRKDQSQVSSPRILAYFLEGTTFDNLLRCDPPSEVNKKTYMDLLAQLQRDGDINNFTKLREVLGMSGLTGVGEMPAAFEAGAGWVLREVVSEKSYLYKSAAPTGLTGVYMIRGDRVSVSSDFVYPFIRLRYQKKDGEVIEGWGRCEDVDFCTAID